MEKKKSHEQIAPKSGHSEFSEIRIGPTRRPKQVRLANDMFGQAPKNGAPPTPSQDGLVRVGKVLANDHLAQTPSDVDRLSITGDVPRDVGPLDDQAQFAGQRGRIGRAAPFGNPAYRRFIGLLQRDARPDAPGRAAAETRWSR